jgi:hypothetical protein
MGIIWGDGPGTLKDGGRHPGRRLIFGARAQTSGRYARRAAFELLAEYADHWNGPAPPRRQEIPRSWAVFSAAEQRDVLDSLGDQVRVAYHVLADLSDGAVPGAGVDLRGIVADMCDEARTMLLALVALEPEPWRMPRCGHCREIAAAALCSLLVQLHAAAGWPPQELAVVARACAVTVTGTGTGTAAVAPVPRPRRSAERT